MALGEVLVAAPFRAAMRTPRRRPLLIEPRHDLLRPLCTMFAQALAAEVNTLTVTFAQLAFQRIAVRTCQGDAVLPQRGLRRADVGAAFVAGHMITRLCDKPRRFPADRPSRVADELFEILAVKRARERPRSVFLVRIALALMPEHGAEALRAEWFQPCDEGVVGCALAGPGAVGAFLHAALDGGRIRKGRALGQPLAHTRRADAAGDDAHGHSLFGHHGIGKWRDETTPATARARLRIVREPPARAIKRGDATALWFLFFLPVISRV